MKLVRNCGTTNLSRANEPRTSQKRTRIAIVDDDSNLRTAVGRLLGIYGFHSLPFDSGEAFLGTHIAPPVACVLLDLMMPGLSGFQVKERLAKSAPHLPVILITANANPEVCLKAEREGFAACLAKPFEASELIPLINQTLRRTTARPQPAAIPSASSVATGRQ